MAVAGVLSFEGVEKAFGGTQALRGVSFDVARGEIVALLGENGAGKSTLIKILGGIHKPDAGRVALDGAPYHHVAKGSDQQVAFIHQDLGLIEWMTVAENVGLARGYPRSGLLRTIDWSSTARMAREALSLVGCDIHPDTRVQALSRTEKSLVAIARALVVRCDFLVLDEPTASLPADEVEKLFVAMRALKHRGVGMIYVSHRLDEIFRVADRVVVLRDGRKVAEDAVAATTADKLVGLIVGRSTFDAFERTERRAGAARVAVRGVRTERAGPVEFEIRQGELLGLVGLRGAGQEEIGRALFGAIRHDGTVTLDCKPLDLSSPHAALGQGVGLMARDRAEESVALPLSVRENAFLNPAAGGRGLWSVLPPRTEAARAAALGRSVGLRPNMPDLAVEGLSGGNQQKVVVGRWLATRRRLLIAEDPTAGVDVGAKAEIYGLIARALDEGLAVLVVSTDFEEVAHICHRALVFGRGRITHELVGPALTLEALILAASASEAA
ncbi:sugar ABC transporter ATP-binding protein [Aureimonas leprariae]|uniref:Sugar ABC transporter ATP-binding protein n=1 Tax=Plantimonas leprariae TaxID=2615207 RepID=A0A7V7TVR0_9HYPH|nr:sugar ABC transporter ATP-binding protein [Aureimonas leprariae]KAB0678996.1 sugar ABC transporter ATP-binding protein [Aureimonas leprariae]